MAVFRVIDAMDAPHGGKLLKLKLADGIAPTLRELKGATFDTRSPRGDTVGRVQVEGFAVFGGRATNARFEKSGRIDVHVRGVDRSPAPIALQWELVG